MEYVEALAAVKRRTFTTFPKLDYSRRGGAGAGFRPANNDIMLVSYPRSGIIWLRFLIAGLSSDSRVNFLNLVSRVGSPFVV
jgi:hypothetical protein